MPTQFLVSPAMTKVIDRIGSRRGWTRAEVMRTAIALYKFCKDEVKAGNKICIFDANGVPIKEIVDI